MSKPKTIPTEFPVEIDGKIHFVKKGDYAKTLSGQLAISLKAEIKRDHVTQMLDAIEAGKKELPPEAPEEIQKLWDRVNEDWTKAVEEVERKEQEAADAKAAKEAEEKKKAEEEQELFLSVKDNNADIGTFSKMFDTGGEAMDRFIPKGNIKDEVLFAAFNSSFKLAEFSNWMKGDLVVALEDRGHLNVCAKIAEERGTPFQSIYRAAKTARVIKPEDRKPGVSFTVYAEIANGRLTKEAGEKGDKEHKENLAALIEKANTLGEDGKSILTSQTARDEVKKAQGKPTSSGGGSDVPPEDDPKAIFLVIDTQAESGQEVVFHKGFPKDLYASGAIVVNPKTNKRFAENGFRKDVANRWLEIAEYKPAEAPAPAAAAKKKAAKKK